MHGSGSVSSISRRDGTFSMESPLIDVDEVLAVLAALVPADPSATGMSALAGEEPGGLTFGHVTARIKVDRGQALGYDVSRLDGAVEIKGTMLTARPLAFDLYGGRYESTLELDLATNRIALVHDARSPGPASANSWSCSAMPARPREAWGSPCGCVARARTFSRPHGT